MVSGRGRAVLYTPGWGPVSSARKVARIAISDERARTRRSKGIGMGAGGLGGL